MGINIEKRKVELIAFISRLQQEDAITAMEKVAQQYTGYQLTQPAQQLVSEAEVQYFKRPIRENITIDDLIHEQNWQPIDEAKMDALVKRIDIQEPIEMLMAQLNP